MQPANLLDYLPLWGLFAVTVWVVLVSVEGGVPAWEAEASEPRT
jgi:hypothetical protein